MKHRASLLALFLSFMAFVPPAIAVDGPQPLPPGRASSWTERKDTRFNEGTSMLSMAEPSKAEEAKEAPSGGDVELAKKLSNPIADLISIPVQFNYDDGYGPKDAGFLRLNIQPVIPFSLTKDWNLITRTIVPVIYQESIADGVDTKFGLGDTVQSFFFSPKQPTNGLDMGRRAGIQLADGHRRFTWLREMGYRSDGRAPQTGKRLDVRHAGQPHLVLRRRQRPR